MIRGIPAKTEVDDMKDYVPLDISPLYNAGIEALADGTPAAVGLRTFRGLPFQVGPGDAHGPCFIALAGSAASVTIPVGQEARRVIFAHRLVESDLMEGGELGRLVAEYRFRLSDGDIVSVPVRERFEIGVAGESFFGAGEPFVAVSDRNDSLQPRYEGPWGEAGRRQTEGIRGVPTDYYLWAWENPKPAVTVDAVEIAPRGPRFIIAAVTLWPGGRAAVRAGREEGNSHRCDPA